MKTFSVAVAVAVVLAVIFIQESSAFPSTGQVEELEEPMNTEFIPDHQEAPVESLEMPVKIRQKRGDCGTCCQRINGKRICFRCCNI